MDLVSNPNLIIKYKIEIKPLLIHFQPKATGEQKTKPTQNSVRELRGLGLSPDLVKNIKIITSQTVCPSV